MVRDLHILVLVDLQHLSAPEGMPLQLTSNLPLIDCRRRADAADSEVTLMHAAMAQKGSERTFPRCLSIVSPRTMYLQSNFQS